MGFLQQLLSSDFMPHGFCYLWDPRIVWLHVISDGLIALSYYCIPVILVYFIRKNHDLPFHRIFWMLGTFILACGTSHLMEIWNVWHGSYLLAGVVKAIAAVVSVVTAVMLIPLIPNVIALPGRMHLQKVNRKLELEIAERVRLNVPIEGPLRRKVTSGFIVAVLLTVFIGFSSWRYARVSAEDADWVAHSYAVMDRLELTSKHVIEVETSARTFALIGQDAFLARYETARSAVAHDEDALRAPLRHICGFTQLLVEEFGSTLHPSARRYLDRIQAGTQKMGLLVDELLNLARLCRHALNRQPTGLNSMVADVVAILQPDAEGRQVEWLIADLPTVKCDPVVVKQIFQNLLANALKFTRPRARAVIEVSHQEEDGQPVFLVRDNGIGFNMKYVDKLFGVFQRLHSAENFEGTGIGLATVQRIVHKHGGRVWTEGKVDKGAAFYFTLGVGKQAATTSNGATAGGQS